MFLSAKNTRPVLILLKKKRKMCCENINRDVNSIAKRKMQRSEFIKAELLPLL